MHVKRSPSDVHMRQNRGPLLTAADEEGGKASLLVPPRTDLALASEFTTGTSTTMDSGQASLLVPPRTAGTGLLGPLVVKPVKVGTGSGGASEGGGTLL